eukprot:COSAG01_NODE_12724_length_1693_cov_3.254078_3_plen_107_part_01
MNLPAPIPRALSCPQEFFVVHGLNAGPVLPSAPVFLKFYLMLPGAGAGALFSSESECVGGRRPRTVKLYWAGRRQPRCFLDNEGQQHREIVETCARLRAGAACTPRH